ncbi:hypothetical protein [Methanoculleus horonobensis]|uniref:hypothetical protein n=1 Tax=Methanoculleus horonobensis TaxID=528314 RepID=UPI000B09B272|nr:hypothetical protein [Methanoculleus horonobensis]
MSLIITAFRYFTVCWLIAVISLLSCSIPVSASASEEPENLPPGNEESPIQSYVEYKSIYPLSWHSAATTRFLNKPDATYTIYNPTAAPVRVRLTSKYPDYGSETINLMRVGANSTQAYNQYTKLSVEKIQEIRTTTSANFYYKIEYWNGDDWVVHDEQTYLITFYPMNQMVWAIEDSNGTVGIYHGLIAAFVTPQSSGVTELLATAKERATSDVDERYAFYGLERSFSGYSSPGSLATYNDTRNYTTLQIKAIYNALKYDYNFSYVSVPVAFGIGDSQRVSPPDESLARGSANCIDGAVLFASAIEAIGMRPYIIITPNHAYVAWDTDVSGTGIDALETTWISDYNFEEAYDVGRAELAEDATRMELYQSLLGLDVSREEYSSMCILVDIDWLRPQGILPMQ